MKIGHWRLENVGPFRGVHEIDLTTGVDVYAVTARYETDEERSNWAGKSFLMKTLPLALFDDYPSESADGWIADGEKIGKVTIVLDDDTSVERKRDISKSKAVVSFFVSVAGNAGSNTHGEERLAEHLGIKNAKEFYATSFIRQKQVNRFVVAKPEERMQIVAEWIGISKLRACRKSAGARYAAARKEAAKFVVESPKALLERLERDVTGILYREDIDPSELREIVEKEYRENAHSRIANDENRVEAARVAYGEAAKKEHEYTWLARDAAEYERLATSGRALQKEIEETRRVSPEEIAAAEKKREAAVARHNAVSEDCSVAAKLRRGEFDGQCPVSGKGCPVAGEIRSDLATGEKRYREATAKRVKALDARQKAESDVSELKIAANELVELRAELKRTADAARSFKEARDAYRALAGTPPSSKATGEAYEAARLVLEGSRGDLRTVESWLADWRAFVARREKAEREGAAAKAALAVAADAVEVFERAEREIGQAVLAEIEELANRLLAGSGVDLEIRMTWGRETGQLEGTCHRCSWQYPRGRGVKECQECGAPRRSKIDERLDLVPSARSDGAAEDLAGLAVQLASAAWKRAEHGVRFGPVVLDEVTASFDRANRRAIGKVLVQMIRDAGFEQGFVISHSPDVVESLPGRIEIVVGRDGSRRIEVR